MLEVQANQSTETFTETKHSCITWLLNHGIDYLHPKDPSLFEMTLSDVRFYYDFNAYYS